MHAFFWLVEVSVRESVVCCLWTDVYCLVCLVCCLLKKHDKNIDDHFYMTGLQDHELEGNSTLKFCLRSSGLCSMFDTSLRVIVLHMVLWLLATSNILGNYCLRMLNQQPSRHFCCAVLWLTRGPASCIKIGQVACLQKTTARVWL